MILTNPKVVEAMSEAENKRAAAEMKKTPSDGSPTFPERLKKAFTVIGCPDTFDEIMEKAEKEFPGSPEPLLNYLVYLTDCMRSKWMKRQPELNGWKPVSDSSAPNVFQKGCISRIDSFVNYMSALNLACGVFNEQSWQRLTAFSKLLFRRDQDESFVALYPRDTDDLAIYVLIRACSPATLSIVNEKNEKRRMPNLLKAMQSRLKKVRVEAAKEKDKTIIEAIENAVLYSDSFRSGLKGIVVNRLRKYGVDRSVADTVPDDILEDCISFLSESLYLETARNTEGHNPKGRGRPASDVAVSGLFAARDIKPNAGYLDRLWNEAAIALCGSTEINVPETNEYKYLKKYLEKRVDGRTLVDIWKKYYNRKNKEAQKSEGRSERREPDLLDRVLAITAKRIPEDTPQAITTDIARGLTKYMVEKFYIKVLEYVNKKCEDITADTSGVTGGVRTDIENIDWLAPDPVEKVCGYIKEHIERFYGKRHRTMLKQILWLSLERLTPDDLDSIDEDDEGEEKSRAALYGMLCREWENALNIDRYADYNNPVPDDGEAKGKRTIIISFDDKTVGNFKVTAVGYPYLVVTVITEPTTALFFEKQLDFSGKQTVTVFYAEEQIGIFTVTAYKIESVAVANGSQPGQMNYYVGKEVDSGNQTLFGMSKDGKKQTVMTGFSYTPSDAFDKAGDKTVTFTYDHKTVTTQVTVAFDKAGDKTITFAAGNETKKSQVTIKPRPMTVIAVTSKPTSVTFYDGEEHDCNGATLTLTDENGETTAEVSIDELPEIFAPANVHKTILIPYNGMSIPFDINVTRNNIVDTLRTSAGSKDMSSETASQDIPRIVSDKVLKSTLKDIMDFDPSKTDGFNPFRLPCMLRELVNDADENEEKDDKEKKTSPLVVLRSILIILTIETEIAAFMDSTERRMRADTMHQHIDNVLMSCGLAPLYDLPDLASEPGASEAVKFDYYISRSLQSVAKLAEREKNSPSQEEWQNE